MIFEIPVARPEPQKIKSTTRSRLRSARTSRGHSTRAPRVRITMKELQQKKEGYFLNFFPGSSGMSCYKECLEMTAKLQLKVSDFVMFGKEEILYNPQMETVTYSFVSINACLYRFTFNYRHITYICMCDMSNKILWARHKRPAWECSVK